MYSETQTIYFNHPVDKSMVDLSFLKIEHFGRQIFKELSLTQIFSLIRSENSTDRKFHREFSSGPLDGCYWILPKCKQILKMRGVTFKHR